MKVVITGGTGLIGSALTDNLLGAGHEVIVLTRNPDEYRRSMPEAVHLVQWDAKTAGEWVAEADGADAVVNLAGASLDNRWTDSYKQRVRDSRVNSGTALIEGFKAMETKPKMLVQASAVGYYGPSGDKVVTEATPPGDDFLADVCQAWEASTADAEKMGIRRVIIRTGIVLSTKSGAMARLIPIFKIGAGGPVGSGKQYYPWIHIGDEVSAIRHLIEDENAQGVYNLSAPNPVQNRVFVKALGRALSRPAIAPAPGIALKLLFGEMSTIVLDGQRAIPERLQEEGFQFRFVEPEPAMRHLLYSGYED